MEQVILRLLRRLYYHLQSTYEQAQLQETTYTRQTFDENHTLCNISLLLSAIHLQHPVSFKYFDYDCKKNKKFRKHGHPYVLEPYAVISNKNRYYCILYNSKYNNHTTYRIDKMDRIEILEEEMINPVPFSLNDYLEKSFDMYSGDKSVSIGLKCDMQILSQVYDEFLNNVIISEYNEDSFTCYIKAPITPTLCSWIIQYHDAIEVLQPQALKDELFEIGQNLAKHYHR